LQNPPASRSGSGKSKKKELTMLTITRIRPVAAALCAALIMPVFAAYADELTLSSGDTLSGTVVERTGEVVVLDHSVLGRLEIPAGQIESMIVDGNAAAPADEAPAQVEPEPEPEEVPARQWKSHFDLAAGGAFGNTDTQNFRVGMVSVRETERNRTALDASYFYGASDGDRTDNRFTAGILHDWLFEDSPWLLFADARYDYDEFKSWEHRIGSHVGLGYELINKEAFKLNLRGGAGAIREFGSEDEDIRPELLAGLDFVWRISERQTLEGGTTIYPDLNDTGEFRAVSSLGWAVQLDPKSNMSLTAGLEHEYESQVDAGIDNHDLRVFAGMAFDF